MNLLGKLSWDAIPLHEPIVMNTVGVVGIVIVATLAWVTAKGYWPYLWREWITSVDHKRIGVMYLVLAMVMLVRGFSDAIMMRSQQAVAAGEAQGLHLRRECRRRLPVADAAAACRCARLVRGELPWTFTGAVFAACAGAA